MIYNKDECASAVSQWKMEKGEMKEQRQREIFQLITDLQMHATLFKLKFIKTKRIRCAEMSKGCEYFSKALRLCLCFLWRALHIQRQFLSHSRKSVPGAIQSTSLELCIQIHTHTFHLCPALKGYTLVSERRALSQYRTANIPGWWGCCKMSKHLFKGCHTEQHNGLLCLHMPCEHVTIHKDKWADFRAMRCKD